MLVTALLWFVEIYQPAVALLLLLLSSTHADMHDILNDVAAGRTSRTILVHDSDMYHQQPEETCKSLLHLADQRNMSLAVVTHSHGNGATTNCKLNMSAACADLVAMFDPTHQKTDIPTYLRMYFEEFERGTLKVDPKYGTAVFHAAVSVDDILSMLAKLMHSLGWQWHPEAVGKGLLHIAVVSGGMCQQSRSNRFSAGALCPHPACTIHVTSSTHESLLVSKDLHVHGQL